MKKYLFAAVLILAGAYLLLGAKSPYAEGTMAGPMHWHPRVSVYIEGEEVRVPDNLGVSRQPHLPVHTHEEGDGTVHFEFSQAKVPRNQLTVGYFMNEVWGQQYNSSCLMDRCNDGKKKVTMTVNGRENLEFERYVMADGDEVEIRYG
ncbi:MAG: hypothetical protein AB1324_00715 [Candidatus Micrarchaeota archaeon]